MMIYIGNLPFQYTEEDIQGTLDLAMHMCTILMVRLMTDENNRSRGFAFVEVPDDEAQNAELLIASLDGLYLDGRKIRSAHVKPRKRRKPKPFDKEAFKKRWIPKRKELNDDSLEHPF